jgi:hypothetical protein
VTHEIFDPPRNWDEEPPEAKEKLVFFFATTQQLMGLALYAANINTYITCLNYLFYGTAVCLHLSRSEDFRGLVPSYVYVFIIMLLSIFALCFVQVKHSKEAFVNKLNLETMHREQRNILEHLPDGAMIYNMSTKKKADGETHVKT